MSEFKDLFEKGKKKRRKFTIGEIDKGLADEKLSPFSGEPAEQDRAGEAHEELKESAETIEEIEEEETEGRPDIEKKSPEDEITMKPIAEDREQVEISEALIEEKPEREIKESFKPVADLAQSEESPSEIEFLSPDESLERSYGGKISAPPKPEEKQIEEKEDIFLTPDEILMRSFGERLEEKKEKEPEKEVGHLAAEKEEPAKEKEEIKRKIYEDILMSPEEILETSPKITEKTVSEEAEEVKPVKDEAPPGKLETLTPMDVEEEEEIKEELKQLDLGPLLKKSAIDSPVELLSPEEMETEEKFVSHALEIGALVRERYKVEKIISEKKSRNCYLVKDLENNKKFILKEIVPVEMSKEELRSRRNKFLDNIRIINTFKQRNLAKVYDGFHENNREYFLMDYIEGLDLTKLASMNVKPFSEKEVIKWGMELCDAIEFMHYRPQPFTLGSFHPHHIIVDVGGVLNIVNYDLQKFFDINRTIEFMPDDPTKLFDDVTKLSRTLYYLLTKEKYEESDLELEWPKHISIKMKKLLEVACKEGQQTYGDIKVFKTKLEATQWEEEDEEKYARGKWGFPLHKLDFTWAVRAFEAVINQRPYMIAIELIFLVFLGFIHFYAFPRQNVNTYVRPTGRPLMYVAGINKLFTIDASDYSILDQVNLGIKAGAMMGTVAKLDTESDEKPVAKSILMVSNLGGNKILLFDMENDQRLKSIDSDFNPFAFMTDRRDTAIWVFHKSSPIVLILNSATLKPESIYRLEAAPSSVVFVPGQLEDKNDNEGKSGVKPARGEEKEKSVETADTEPITDNRENVMRGFLVAFEKERKIIAINPYSEKIIGKLKTSFSPGLMLFSNENQVLYVLDRKNKELIPYDYARQQFGSPIVLPEDQEAPTDMLLLEEQNEIWLCFNKTDNLARLDLTTGKFSNPFFAGGTEPTRMFFDESAKRIWILAQGTKNIIVKDAATEKTLRDIPLGEVPMDITLVR